MQTQTEKYTPEWISQQDACKWLGVSKVTLWRMRSKGIAWTTVNNRSVMYDKKSIQKILDENSTYKFQTQ